MSVPPRFLGQLAALFTVASTATFIGCGGDEFGQRYPVEGTVTYNGQPVEAATITFVPKDPEGRGASGKVENGSYTLTTIDPGDGALPGEYRVTVDARSVDDAKAKEMARDLIRKQGGDPDATTVIPQQIQAQALAQAPSSIPGKYQIPDTSDLDVVVEEKSNVIDLELTD